MRYFPVMLEFSRDLWCWCSSRDLNSDITDLKSAASTNWARRAKWGRTPRATGAFRETRTLTEPCLKRHPLPIGLGKQTLENPRGCGAPSGSRTRKLLVLSQARLPIPLSARGAIGRNRTFVSCMASRCRKPLDNECNRISKLEIFWCGRRDLHPRSLLGRQAS